MADEWGVLGWTAQQPATTYAQASTAPWQIPADVDTVKVFGEYHSLDGGIVVGYVEFKASVSSFVHTADKVNVTTPDFVAVIGQDGKFSVNLPATDTTALSPSGFTYTITVVIGRQTVKTLTCNLPKATPSVNINDLVAL